MHITCVGGGSLGPVTPLLATVEALKKKNRHIKISWIGTPEGPERTLVEARKITFYPLSVAKWPRYPSFAWLAFPKRWWCARREARELVKRLRPDAVVSVGGFTAVPVMREAFKQSLPCFIHQLDLEPGISNRMVARFCKSVTTSFEYVNRPFGDKVCDEPIATPVRYTLSDLSSRAQAAQKFGLDLKRPIVFVYGGGQGAQALNEFVERVLQDWLVWTQVIHVTGPGKIRNTKKIDGYSVHSFLDEEHMCYAHAAADLEICRGGMGALSEIAALQKAAVIIPIPDSHQEANAQAFEERGAVLVFDQRSPTFDDEVSSSVRFLLDDSYERKKMGERAQVLLPTDKGEALASRILSKAA